MLEMGSGRLGPQEVLGCCRSYTLLVLYYYCCCDDYCMVKVTTEALPGLSVLEIIRVCHGGEGSMAASGRRIMAAGAGRSHFTF